MMNTCPRGVRDPPAIMQILFNLVGKRHKVHQYGRVSVLVTADRMNHHRYYSFKVKDTGNWNCRTGLTLCV